MYKKQISNKLQALLQKESKQKGKEKNMNLVKKLLTVVIALVMMLGLSVTVNAANAEKDSGKNGEGTLTITNANKEQTYELYRIFEALVNDTDPKKVSYKPLEGKTIPENDFFKVDNGNIIVQDAAKDSTDDTQLSAGAIEWLSSNYQTIGEKVTDVTPTETGEQKVTRLPYGYYYITTTTGTAVSVDTTNKEATVTDKNPGTTIVKNIIGVNDGSVKGDKESAIAQIGTVVTYEVRISIAQNAKTYKFTDVMSDGLTYNEGSMKVYVVEKDAGVVEGETEELNQGTDEETKYGTLTEAADASDNNPDVTIVFNDAMLAANNGKDIVLQYTATLNKDAVVAGENPNTAAVHWGHETDSLMASDTAKVYTAQITVKKVDGSNKALEGAGFKLKDSNGKWYKLTDGIVSWVDQEADGTEIFPVQADVDNPEYDENENPDVPETIKSEEATASFIGLADGEYTLVETTVPDGYNKAKDHQITIKDVAANNLLSELTVTSIVTNNQGTELPETGGMGTTLFYVLGTVLVAAAGILLVSRRRMSE